MIKKGKYFVTPHGDGSTFKQLFKKLAAAGAGRPVGDDGFPAGPWTPDLLAAAISEIEGNKAGIELRTVQLWFQENERGISAENIRWLARVFGCDDPVATADWQVALSAALAVQRRNRRQRREDATPNSEHTSEAVPESPVDTLPEPILPAIPIVADQVHTAARKKFCLARTSEALFSRGSPLNLPASIFAGAVALGFLSFIMGIHNVSYNHHGVTKQIGYLWAPNWTVLFMVFLPLFLGLVSETLLYWKREGRSRLVSQIGDGETVKTWMQNIEASSFTFWSVFLICSIFAGVIQWIGVRLGPLLNGQSNYSVDWGSVAVIRPDVVSVPLSIAFTGIAYLYMSFCFYTIFVGLILLYTIVYDYGKLADVARVDAGKVLTEDGRSLARIIIICVFRCSMLVILIAMAMKLQSLYLSSDAENILIWLMLDIRSFMNIDNVRGSYFDVSMPNHFSSLVVLLATCFVFVYGIVRLRLQSTDTIIVAKMIFVSALLCSAYFLMGSFVGWVVLLGVSSFVAICAIFDPEFSLGKERGIRGGRSVS